MKEYGYVRVVALTEITFSFMFISDRLSAHSSPETVRRYISKCRAVRPKYRVPFLRRGCLHPTAPLKNRLLTLRY